MTNAGTTAPWDGLTEARALLDFGRAARVPYGFGELDAVGRVAPGQPLSAIVTARMTHCYSLASLLGEPGGDLAEHGISALRTAFADAEFGGFHSQVPVAAGLPDKRAYQHAFVVLAASTARVAGIAGAEELLVAALGVLEERFWSPSDGALRESFDRTFAVTEPYWGANANMHAVEALLAAHAATGEPLWRDQALRIAETFIDGQARSHNWMLPEHYHPDWTPDLDYHADQPDHEFRPYGVTIGHLYEWSRLLLELHTALAAGAEPVPDWLVPAAAALFSTATRRGWAVDGAPGFVYTVDWDGTPVVHQRLHWVACEAIAAAASWRAFGDPPELGAAQHLAPWLAYAQEHLIDRAQGSWRHELDRDNRPAATIKNGKPDLYHALQACLATVLPVAPSFAARALAAGGTPRQGTQ